MNEVVTLLDLKPGDSGIVKGFAPGNADYRRRLMAMGLTPGTPFTVTRLAPLGDPIQLQVRHSALTLRKDEATLLRIVRADPT
ncbi:MAG TPA: FeoA family protein [Halothiobacillus sp.]|nr:MAG: ferrous iron transport protein A [Halothiobacillus sp. 20-54-6]HQT42955.1 FeoA family protein [Halothiobacillus sp.]